MAQNKVGSGYAGFSYGEVTPDCEMENGEHTGTLVNNCVGDIIDFQEDVCLGTRKIGFTANFSQDAPFSSQQVMELEAALAQYFSKSGLDNVNAMAIKYEEAFCNTLSLVYYVPVEQKAALEEAISSINRDGRAGMITMSPPPEQNSQRADGNEWKNSLGSRTGRVKD